MRRNNFNGSSNNDRLSENGIRCTVQDILDARSKKALDVYDAANALNRKIAEGLQKVLGDNPERVLANLPNRTPRKRFGGGGRLLSDEAKIKMLTRAIIRDFKIIKCARIAEMMHSRSGKSIDCSDLQRIPNLVLDALESTIASSIATAKY